MARRLTKVPITVYVPAVYPVPGRPAYCETVRTLAGYTTANGQAPVGAGSSGGGKIVYTPPDPLNPLSPGTWGLIPSLGSFVIIGPVANSPLRPRYVYVEQCYPAVPGRAGSPARVDRNANSGWNAGARSIRPVSEFGYARGRMLPTLVATQFGLADVYFDHTYAYMPHSVVARTGEWSVVESGATVATGALADRALVEIRRAGGIVTYRIDGEVVHTSAVPSAGEVYAAALLYSLGDGVDDAAVGIINEQLRFTGSIPATRILAADVADLALMIGETPLPVLTSVARPLDGAVRFLGQLPAIRGIGSTRHVSLLNERTPRFSLQAVASRPERQLTQMAALLSPITLRAFAQSGASASLDASLPQFPFIAADRAGIAVMRADAPVSLVLYAVEAYMPAGQFDGTDSVIALDGSSLDSALLLLAMDSLDVSSSGDLFIVIDMVGMDSLSFSDTGSLGQLVEMLALERVAINSTTARAQREAIQYAVNIATGALSVYEGFDFQGFAHVGQDTYGWKPDGLYRIGASLDEGELIRALIDFGTSDYGSAFVKRAEMAYLGVRTDGQCFLRVAMDEGSERIYRVRGDDMRRAKLGSGISGRSVSLKLELADASYAEVDSLELLIGVTQRRGFGTRN